MKISEVRSSKLSMYLGDLEEIVSVGKTVGRNGAAGLTLFAAARELFEECVKLGLERDELREHLKRIPARVF